MNKLNMNLTSSSVQNFSIWKLIHCHIYQYTKKEEYQLFKLVKFIWKDTKLLDISLINKIELLLRYRSITLANSWFKLSLEIIFWEISSNRNFKLHNFVEWNANYKNWFKIIIVSQFTHKTEQKKKLGL